MHNIKIDGLCIYFLKVLHIIYLGRVQNIYFFIQNDGGHFFYSLSSKIFVFVMVFHNRVGFGYLLYGWVFDSTDSTHISSQDLDRLAREELK